ncbi:hypothetical protein [Mesorhizobium australicum]|uniref:Mu-like prophage FluMu N-terminal domain-containing protein n=1 Tax=Mesorhizobium australicum TaxID=536018 RepID=A0A1X7NX46_9HYPH|nr:hypothetical protein [Mesorhizobium australicum]SMH42476.1 hypothetical protein SAMN02982922_2746 [Mesorhizobium australicum]
MAKASKPTRAVKVPDGAAVAEAAVGKSPVDAGGAQPDPALAEERVSSSVTNTQGKPPRPDEQDGSAEARPIQADTGAGDPDTNTPRGSSGTAREASSTDGGTTAETPSVGTQSGSPNGMFEEAMEEARAMYPCFFTASETWKAAHPGTLPTIVRISSKIEGFRRADLAHSKAPVDHSIFDFDPDRLERLLAEPNLRVEFA